MKHLRFLLGIGVLAVATGCDKTVAPPTTGSISLRLQAPAAAPAVSSVLGAEASTENQTLQDADAAEELQASQAGTEQDGGPQLRQQSPAEPAGHLQSIRVTVAGATNKSQSFNCTASLCTGTVDGLAPGSYSVTVEGLVGTEVDYFGQTSGVAVEAGASTTATISFQSFRPVLADVPDTTEVLRFTVSYSAVPGAASYVVEWATAADFSGASSATLTGTSTEITVAQEARYHVRVRAVNSVVTTGGAWSAPKSIFAFQGVATVTVTPANPSIAQGATQQLTAEPRDADNNVVSGVTFFWSSDDPSVATVNQSGLATARGLGQATITAVGKGQPGSTTLTVTTGTATDLAFVDTPPDGEPGGTIDPIEVAVLDAFGNVVNTAVDVTIAIEDDASGGMATLSGTLTQTSVSGIATFDDLSINLAGDGYTLTATATATALNDDTSDPFDVFLDFVQISTGPFTGHSCGVTTTGAAYCWGLNGLGELGTGDNDSRLTPARVTGGHIFTSVDVGLEHTCGVRATDGAALCWGFGNGGQLGDGNGTDSNVPVVVSGGHTFSSISAGDVFTCGVRTDGFVFCWGAAANGRLGNNTTTPQQNSPDSVETSNTYDLVSAGENHACGIRSSDDRVLCWGAAGSGRLGNNLTTPDQQVPVLTTNTSAFSAVSAGGSHTCGVRASDGAAFCWGFGGQGRVGDNITTGHDVLNPAAVVGGLRFGAVSTGEATTCAISTGGSAFCWGAAVFGGLGNGTTTPDVGTPQAVLGGHIFSSLDAGRGGQTCGVATDGAFCWGRNDFGQLGDGTTSGSSAPVPVKGSR